MSPTTGTRTGTTGRSTTGTETERSTTTKPWISTDPIRVATVTAMGAVVAVIAGGIFDRPVPALVVPPLAAEIAWICARWLWMRGRRDTRAAGARSLVAVTVLVTSILVMTVVSAFLVALLAGGGPGDVLAAVVHGPRRTLTTEWPSPVEPSIVTAVGIFLGLATATAVVVANGRWRLLPLIPLAIAAVVVIALGAPHPPAWWTLTLLGVGALVVGVLPPGEPLGARLATVLGDRTVPATVAAVAVVATTVAATGVAAVLASGVRADPRRVEDAEAVSTVLDPIEATVALRRADPPLDLLEITDRSTPAGRSLPTRWRLAALDVYDGQRWVPQVTLRPIGERLGPEPASRTTTTRPVTYDVVYLTDDVDLVPFPGRPLAIDVPVETDVGRVAVRLPKRPPPGTTVTATATVSPPAASLGAVATDDGGSGVGVARRPIDELAQRFADQARELAGDGDLWQQLRTIETTLRTEWILDRDVAGGGQQLALLERFVTDTRRGTREQFVTAFVLFARALGVDARVATGFVVPPGSVSSQLVIESEHAAAWPEVRLASATGDEEAADASAEWVAFDPVPEPTETIDDDAVDPPQAQSPAAAQPPIQPPSEETDDEDDAAAEPTAERGRWATIAVWAARVTVVVSIGLLPIAVVVGGILAIKWWRRRRRLRHPDAAQRVRGAWANVADSLVDAGLSIAPAWTDDRIARGGEPLAPSTPHELRRLAAMATAVTFGARGDAWRLVDDAASTSRSIEIALRTDRTRWQRVRLRLSLRSLRPGTRSPVVP